jgi:hypothetical protein
MTHQTALAHPRQPLKAHRRAGPTKRREAARSRRIEILRAVTEPHAPGASRRESALIAQCITPGGVRIDGMARRYAHPDHAELSPLAATRLFAEVYARLMSDEEWPWGATYKRHDGLESMAIPDLNAMWRARAQADALGMTYNHYIGAIAFGHAAQGFVDAPSPTELSGPVALAVASFSRDAFVE